MATTVREIMNNELLTLKPHAAVEAALRRILAYGVSTAPVIDDDGAVQGVVSLKDLIETDAHTVGECMRWPVLCVRVDASVEASAEMLARTGLHHLVVINAQRMPVGFVSSLDVIRGLIGWPTSHPPTFSHYDDETELVWSDPAPLSARAVGDAPEGRGLLVLIRGGAGEPETIVLVESAPNIRARLLELAVGNPNDAPRVLRPLLGLATTLRFRAAACDDRLHELRVRRMLRRRGGLLQTADADAQAPADHGGQNGAADDDGTPPTS